MNSTGKLVGAMLMGVPLAVASVNAMAVAKSWNLPSLCNPNTSFKNNSLVTQNSPYTNAPGTCAGSQELLSVSAWSDTGSSSKLQAAYIGDYGTGGLGVTSTAGQTASPTGTLAAGSTADTTGGITTETTASPNHAMDDQFNKESILLTYSTAVSLTSFQIGFLSGDSDMSVLRYTGSGTPNLTAVGYAGLTGAGWSVVGNYANVPLNTDVAVAGTSVTSSYWLITAYNSVFGTGTNLDNSNDFVKLLSVAVNVPTSGGGGGAAPEPSSVLLMGIGIAGLAASRRRRALSR